MTQPLKNFGFLAACLVTAAVGLPGCDTATGLTSGSASASGSALRGVGDSVSVLTSGDAAGGFAEFAAGGGRPFSDGEYPAELTAEQQGEIESLQEQLNAGTIDRAEFGRQVQEIVRDLAPNMAFGGSGFGGSPFGFGDAPFGAQGRFDKAEVLGLSEEQQEQASDIFRQLHSDIADLRSEVHDHIRAVLTDDQLATLEARRPERPNLGSSFAGRPSGGGRPACERELGVS